MSNMNIKKFLFDEKPFIFYNLFLFIIISLIILVSPLYTIAFDTLFYIGLIQITLMFFYLFILYIRKKKLIDTLDNDVHNNSLYSIEAFKKNNEEQHYFDIISNYYNQLQDFMDKTEKEYLDNLDLITIWGHDIKTPIAATKLLLENFEENNDLSLLTSMSNELLKIEDDVNKMIQLTRLNNFEKDLYIEKVNLKSTIHDMIKKNSKYFISKKIILNIDLDDILVLSDKKWLSFVFEQIITNALKYTDKGGSISIKGVENKNYFLLTFKDNGLGILPEDLPNIFNKGFTGTNGRNNLNSTGIGLYLTKEICNKLNHQIHASSIYGKYTEITISFNIKTQFSD